MNPADTLTAVTADVSILALFLQAHWIVKSVMLGLLACSIWVWAVAIDKTLLTKGGNMLSIWASTNK